MNENAELLSYIKDGCYYVYVYKKTKFLTKVELSAYTSYQDGMIASDIAVLSGTDEPLMDKWEIAMVANSGAVVTLTEFYPDLESATKAYGEYLI